MRMETRWLAAALTTLSACTTDVLVADDAGSTPNAMGSTTTDPSTGPAIEGSSGSDGTTGADDPETESGSPVKLDVGVSESDGEPPGEGCIDGNDVIWVLVLNQDENRQPELHRFDPAAPGFEWVADMECLPLKNVGDNPLSLAVARNGGAWLSMDLFEGIEQGQYLYSFDLFANDPCSTLAMEPWSPPAQGNSLAFVALDPDVPEDESLFAHTQITQSLGIVRFDLPIVAVDYVGQSSHRYMTLAGTADARMFGIGGDDSFSDGELLSIDPVTAEPLESLLDTNSGAHPAFYGGDLLIFEVNQQPPGWAPRVHQYDLDDDDGNGEHELTEIFGAANDPPNLWIRGVASPTCIPVTPEG